MCFARLTSLLVAIFSLASIGSATAGPTLLFEPKSGKILYGEDIDQQWHPASLTKIMTAYLVFEAIKAGKLTRDQRIPYSEIASVQEPSKLGLPIGAELTVDSALKALIIKSANDVAMMLAEAVGGSEAAFVSMMNNTAQRLGMRRTNFVNPHGLPALQQVTTARDLAILSRAVVNDYPEYAEYWNMDDARIGKIRLSTHNGLLRTFDGADGLKTGFTCDSGYNVVASASREGTRILAVVLGEASGHDRTIRAASLLEHGFREYGWKQIFNTKTLDDAPNDNANEAVTSVRMTVRSWDCGGRKASARAKAKAKKKPTQTIAATDQSMAKSTAKNAGSAKEKKKDPAKATNEAAPSTEKKSKKISTAGSESPAEAAAKPQEAAPATKEPVKPAENSQTAQPNATPPEGKKP